MTAEELKKAREICDAATEGNWHWHGSRPYSATGKHELHLDGFLGDGWSENDKRFIAAARTGWPEALDEIERLKEYKWKYEELCK